MNKFMNEQYKKKKDSFILSSHRKVVLSLNQLVSSIMKRKLNISVFSTDPKRMEKMTGATRLELESMYVNYYDMYPTLDRNSTVEPTLESVSKYEE